MVSLGGGRAWKQQGGGHTTEPTDYPHFLYLPGSLPQSARRPVPPHRLVATLPQPSCIYFISIVCDRPNAASGLRRVQALGELARAWFVHILRASSIARFRATEPARSSKSKSPEPRTKLEKDAVGTYVQRRWVLKRLVSEKMAQPLPAYFFARWK